MRAGKGLRESELPFFLRALRYRNYRLFFSGQIVSLIGTWITTTASSWLVYRLTGSARLLGIVGFAGQIPAFLMAPVSGVLVDRWNRHRLLLLTQALSMLESFALAGLTLSHRITIHALIWLNMFQGVVNAFDMPCRQSFVVSMIENKEDLGNAIALNSSMVNAARLIGPTIAGLVIAASNEGWCFLIDGVSYVAVLVSLLFVRVRPEPRASAKKNVLHEWRDGWRYVSRFGPVRSIILLLALISLVGVPYGVLIPVIVGKILGGGPHTLGALMTASGLGALVGALWLANRASVLGLGRVVPVAAAVFGMSLIAFSLSRTVWLSLLILPFAGFGFIVQMASSNTIVQTIVDDEMRGRVMSFFMMAFLGTVPFGSLLAGNLADSIGAPRTLLFGGVCCLAGALWFSSQLPAIRARVRPIYARKGIITEVAEGLRAAAQVSVPPE